VRVGFSDVDSEKEHIEFLKATTTGPVPQPCKHYQSEEFEHLVRKNITGTAIKSAWPTLSPAERTPITGQVVELISELPNLAADRVCLAIHTSLVD